MSAVFLRLPSTSQARYAWTEKIRKAWFARKMRSIVIKLFQLAPQPAQDAVLRLAHGSRRHS